ncbi:MAG TPA: cbb3-type cytochrome c oxidase N-terminal domain-containing protein [Saprospiraceae bacterium]|nr:c-type cytochrome [Lewinellaceae bacterium]HPR00290.1 cbb3-type cytochrome c oxidase N-terminal domain-containing protein [Saprospiraceae bacterium]HRV85287.1 cbb3-type cytochrome c oxidase N-terminal domain-containing protein [Saprospiraceae bacterium]
MKNQHTSKYILPAILLLAPGINWAQDAATTSMGTGKSGSDLLSLIYDNLFLILGVVVVGIAIWVLYRTNETLTRLYTYNLLQQQGISPTAPEAVQTLQESSWRRLMKRLTNRVPQSKEKDILFDHDYDGIYELDNVLPPWWLWMFYFTIGFAVIYLGYYHFSGSGWSSKQEYEMAMKEAKQQVAEYVAAQGNLVDETNVTARTDDAALAQGKDIWIANCVACHGANGEGGVGPNMTDKYWIHGGDIKNIFNTIKYGVPEKGMISWQTQLSPSAMADVASYILTLQGTNPPNAKAPQGDLYNPEGAGETTPASEVIQN